MNRNKTSSGRQMESGDQTAGFALLAVLVIVALLTLVVVGLAHRLRVDIELGSHRLEREQRRLCLASGVEVARELLRRDMAGATIDHPGERWAQPIVIETAMGSLAIEIQDEAGKLDLNGPFSTDRATASEERQRARRFAARLDSGSREIDQALAHVLQVISTRRSPLATLDQLRTEAEIPRELLYERDAQRPVCVADFVTIAGDGKVNLNSASASLLAGLAEGMSSRMVRALLDFRGEGPAGEARRPIRSIDELVRAGVFALASESNRVLRSRQEEIVRHVREWSDVSSRFFGVRVLLKNPTGSWLALAVLERQASTSGASIEVNTLVYEEIR